MNTLTRALVCAALVALSGCSAAPATQDSTPTDTSPSDATATADVEASADVVAPAPTPPQPGVALDVLYEEENIESLDTWSFEFTEWESFGPFKIFMPIAEVIEVLGEPAEVTQESEWYGSVVDHYVYPAKGYGFVVARDGDDYDGKVLSISVRSPALEVSKLGIKVGSTVEEAEAAYGPYVNRRVSREGNISVGFMYTWFQFLTADGVVVEMQVGTGDPFDSFGDGED